ncbi:glycoside hydrolase, partial [Paraphaeosphaeria sporulosa]
ALAATAAAHGTVTGIIADGTYTKGFDLQYYYMIQNGQTPPATPGWYAENLDNGFVAPDAYTTADINCHKNAKAATSSASVKAGGKVDFQWSSWPQSHVGPMITYVAKCDADCADADKTALKWVKIDEAGFTDDWASNKMIANNNTWSVTVPSTLASGNYVFRHETIALHGAGSENGAQNYPQCLNIEITGGGSDNPEGTLGTALYTPTDAGILYNVYGTSNTGYKIPGPALY